MTTGVGLSICDENKDPFVNPYGVFANLTMSKRDIYQNPEAEYDASFGIPTSRHSFSQPLSASYSSQPPITDLFHLQDFSQEDSPSSTISTGSGYPFPQVGFDPSNLTMPTEPMHGRRSAPPGHAQRTSGSMPPTSAPEQNNVPATSQQETSKPRGKSKTSRINHNHSEARYRSRLNSSIVALAELIPQAYLRSQPAPSQSPLSAPPTITTPMNASTLAEEPQTSPLLGSGSADNPETPGQPQQPHFLKREVLDAASAYIKDLRAAIKQASDDLARISGEYANMEHRNRELEERVRDLNSRLMAFEYIAQTREMLIG